MSYNLDFNLSALNVRLNELNKTLAAILETQVALLEILNRKFTANFEEKGE